jgi:hypothetical protein
MEFRTIVTIPHPEFEISPCEPLLFVGSCFADSIGQRFRNEGFPVTVNPFGTMYNPASILHTIQRLFSDSSSPSSSEYCKVLPRTVFLTLGTNHVYRLRSTDEIVDNCEKRPAALFQEEELHIDVCVDYLLQSVTILRQRIPDVRIVLSVSPIRYRKYGYHESQLSKATLLLSVEKLNSLLSITNCPVYYFPSYEILMDELRDYRFYATDMLHPSQQAVDYIWERIVETFFSPAAKQFLDEWRPLRQVLSHRPFNADSEEHKILMDKTMLKVEVLRKKYPTFAL